MIANGYFLDKYSDKPLLAIFPTHSFMFFLYLYMFKSNIYFTPNLLYNNNYLKLRGTLDFEIIQLMLCPLVLITVFILVVLYHYYLNIIQIVFK